MQDQNGIYITKKQASVTTAILLLLGLAIFIAGYFLGKKSIIDGFTQKTSQESFNDQVDYVLTMQSFVAKHGNIVDAEQAEEKTTDSMEKLPDALEEAGELGAQVKTEPVVIAQSEPSKNSIMNSSERAWYGTLAGFAKKVSAQAMLERLKKHRIEVEIKPKTSRLGKTTRTWYQVVTKKYTDKDELARVVDKISALEHIKKSDIKII